MKKQLEWFSIDEPNSQTLTRLLGFFTIVGLLTRVVRYYLCFPLWDDESFLCVNFISRTYAQLLQPLDYHQVAPILFLWIERSAVCVLGFSEYSLRLVPFLCAIASLFVFRRVAERLLRGWALVFAVAVFAVSYPGIRYAAEAKPYCTDMFISLIMLWQVVEWHSTRDVRWLVVLTVLMPLALGFSYPAVFAAGGFSLATCGTLAWKKGRRTEWIAWGFWNVSLVISFVCWFSLVGRVQSGAETEFMSEYWKTNFPPVAQPWMLPFWMLKTHASDFLAYPVGGPNWASSLTLLVCLIGLWYQLKSRNPFWVAMILGPACLHLVAASLEKYPYGGHVKFSQYLAPMICCLIGVGTAELISWSSRWKISRLNCTFGCSVILLLIAFGSLIRDLANPCKTRSDFRARAFAQSFWPGTHSVEEVACLKSDLGLDFIPKQHSELSWSAHYLCNRAIEVSRSSLRAAKMDRVSVNRPLRCVMYHDARFDVDRERLENWLQEMQIRYELVTRESVPFPRMTKDDRRLVTMEYIESFKFIPREVTAKTNPVVEQTELLEQ